MKKSCSGSISLYCSMIFLFILAFLGSLLWLSKQQIMKTGLGTGVRPLCDTEGTD